MAILEARVVLPVAPEAAFAFLDDQVEMGRHMEKPSLMMMGGRMTYQMDALAGRAVGSVITMGGSFLGLTLSVVETVTERTPPVRKVWATSGPQQLLIMASYRMGFDLSPGGSGAALRVWIDYALPPAGVWRWVGTVLAPLYARWCVGRMANDAQRHFGGAPVAAAPWPVTALAAAYAAVTAPVFALWEWAHLPLYTLWAEQGPGASYWAAVHCTVGDMILAFATAWLALMMCAAVPSWRNWTAAATGLVMVGVAATALLEIISTQWLARWAYSAAMPQVLGIGLSPLVQWSVVPLFGAFALRQRIAAALAPAAGGGRQT